MPWCRSVLDREQCALSHAMTLGGRGSPVALIGRRLLRVAIGIHTRRSSGGDHSKNGSTALRGFRFSPGRTWRPGFVPTQAVRISA